MKDCIVCERIPPKVVFLYAHRLFARFSREDIHRLAREACELISFVDGKRRVFFCGHSSFVVLAGLFYCLGRFRGCRVTQQQVAESFKSTREDSPHMPAVSVRRSAERWTLLLADLGCLVQVEGSLVLQLHEQDGEN